MNMYNKLHCYTKERDRIVVSLSFFMYRLVIYLTICLIKSYSIGYTLALRRLFSIGGMFSYLAR